MYPRNCLQPLKRVRLFSSLFSTCRLPCELGNGRGKYRSAIRSTYLLLHTPGTSGQDPVLHGAKFLDEIKLTGWDQNVSSQLSSAIEKS
jgi:hypothetical protein